MAIDYNKLPASISSKLKNFKIPTVEEMAQAGPDYSQPVVYPANFIGPVPAGSKFAAPPSLAGKRAVAQVTDTFKGGINQVVEGVMQGANAQNPLQLFEGSLKMGAGAIGAAFSPLAPVFAPVGEVINALGNKISDIPGVQRFADSPAGETASRVAEDTANLAAIAGIVAGSETAMGTKLPPDPPGMLRRDWSIGITSFRGKPVATVAETAAYFETPRAKGFVNTMTNSAPDFGVQLNHLTKTSGFWEGKIEPSFIGEVSGHRSDVFSYASTLGKKGGQDAILLFKAGPGKGTEYIFNGVADLDAALQMLKNHGVSGATVDGNHLLFYDADGSLVKNLSDFSNELGINPFKTNGEVKFIGRDEYSTYIGKGRVESSLRANSQSASTFGVGTETQLKTPASAGGQIQPDVGGSIGTPSSKAGIKSNLEPGTREPSGLISSKTGASPDMSIQNVLSSNRTNFLKSFPITSPSTDSITQFLATVKTQEPVFLAATEDLARQFGGEYAYRMKTVNSLITKLGRKTGRSLASMNDTLASTIIVKDSQVENVAKFAQEKYGVGKNGTRVDDFRNNPGFLGYKAVHLDQELPNGMWAEVQINSKEGLYRKTYGHTIYDRWRVYIENATGQTLDDVLKNTPQRYWESFKKDVNLSNAIYEGRVKVPQKYIDEANRLLRTPSAGAPPGTSADKVPVFKGFKDVSTKVLDRLTGKSVTSKQEISDFTNMPELKQAERDLIRNMLKDEGPQVNVQTFANKVKTELLPLERSKEFITSSGTTSRYENTTLPDELRGNVANYSEHIYESPIKTSAGDVHFNYPKKPIDNYFAHTRVEDMATVEDYTVGNKPVPTADNTRRVIELQSDLFQKGRLEDEFGGRAESGKTFEQLGYNRDAFVKSYGERAANKYEKEILAKESNLSKLEPYRNTWHERVIREEVKQAAVDGKTKLQFPTGETAMKIEGLGESTRWYEADPGTTMSSRLTDEMLSVGKPVTDGHYDWIITDVLGDGKFKAVTKDEWETRSLGKKIDESLKESFDISGKVDTNNPIYKFYEKEVGRYLKNKYNAVPVTDKHGVDWWEVKVDPKLKNKPVGAFASIPGRTLS